jgi:thiol-disulfide isomerase/thioredoxin
MNEHDSFSLNDSVLVSYNIIDSASSLVPLIFTVDVYSIVNRIDPVDKDRAAVYYKWFENKPVDELWKRQISELYERHFASDSIQLPAGKATDLFNNLLEPYRGKYVLVDFWGTGCGPCRSYIERTVDFRNKYAGSDKVQFLFITGEGNSPSEKVYNEYIGKYLSGWPSLRLPNEDNLKLATLFNISGIPHYVLVDADGSVLSMDFEARGGAFEQFLSEKGL